LTTKPALRDTESASVAGLTDFEHGVIDIFVRLADVLGVPKSVGEIYGLLFASAQPLAFQDIIDRLQISKGSASQGLQLLRSVGAIKLVYVAGDRRDHFVPETEMRALLTGFLRERIQPHLESGALRVKALQTLARGSFFGLHDAKKARVLRDRAEKLYAWHKKGKLVIPLAVKYFG
jgi:DNA-binding transcriptional regulator GbsR (MarR family)